MSAKQQEDFALPFKHLDLILTQVRREGEREGGREGGREGCT